MSISIVQAGSVVAATMDASLNATLPGALTLGNVSVLVLTFDGNDGVGLPTSVGDGLGNVYELVDDFINTDPPGGITSLVVYAAQVAHAGVPVSTLVGGQSQRGGGAFIEVQVSGGNLVEDVAKQTAQAATGTTVTTPNLTTTKPIDLLLLVGASLAGGSTTFGVTSGYTIETQGATDLAGTLAIATQVTSSSGTFDGGFTGMASGGFNAAMLLALTAPAAVSGAKGNVCIMT